MISRSKTMESSLSSKLLFLLQLSCVFLEIACDWIDPDTPAFANTTQAIPIKFIDPNNKYTRPSIADYALKNSASYKENAPTYVLVMSDEFNVPHRNFSDGMDPKWTALNKNDYTNDALHYYSHDNIYTNTEGELVIKTEVADTEVIGFDDKDLKDILVTKHLKSGMLQSWNKFCMTGGIIEAEVQLPGWSDVGGLWPSFWLLGNLARHTYVSSASHIWPFATSSCSSKTREAQLINGCLDSVHYGLHPNVGRGAPEIDIFEMQPGEVKRNHGSFWQMAVGQPFMSASYQVAPGKADARPGNGWWPAPGAWYDGLRFGVQTSLNILFYGTYNNFLDDIDPKKQDYWSDAISFNRQLDNSFFEGNHLYRLEWELPDKEKGEHGHLHWFLDGELVLAINGKSLEDAKTGAEISQEPSSFIFNTAVSTQWGFNADCSGSCPCKLFNCRSPKKEETCGFSQGFCAMLEDSPPEFKVNWIRVYQNPDDEKQKVGCSTPERPTKRFIEGHVDKYKQKIDERPLKDVQHGRGICNVNQNSRKDAVSQNGSDGCGGIKRGFCTSKNICKCNDGWTGPHCLVPAGHDPIDWELPETLKFDGPSTQPLLMSVVILLTGYIMVKVVKDFQFSTSKKKEYALIETNTKS